MNDIQTRDLTRKLNEFFESTVEIPRIRVGKQQTVETLINEEAMLMAKHLRDEMQTWIPRITSVDTVKHEELSSIKKVIARAAFA